MTNRIKTIIVFLLFFQASICLAQTKKSKWTNKDKGTYTIKFNHIGIYPADTLPTGISNMELIGISVKLYELSPDSCIQIEGKVKINNREFKINNNTNFIDSDSIKNQGTNFGIWAAAGEYKLTALVNNEYYPVKTDNNFLTKGSTYQFNFYLVRKDALKKSRSH